MTSISRHNSADAVKEIRLNLAQLKSTTSRSSKSSRRSCTTIQDELLKKHHKSQEKIDKKRLKSKSKEMQKLKLIPQINSKSNQIIQNKHNKEIEEFIVKIKKTSSKDLNETIEMPKDPIKPPDITTVKGMFNSRSYLKKEPVAEKVNPNILNIVDKSKFYMKKKSFDSKAAEIRKVEEVMKECTFKPDLSKTRRGKSFESLIDILNTDDKVYSENPRPPAPNPRISPKKLYSNLLDDQVYSFKEGVNLSKILEKSRPLLSYNMKVSS